MVACRSGRTFFVLRLAHPTLAPIPDRLNRNPRTSGECTTLLRVFCRDVHTRQRRPPQRGHRNPKTIFYLAHPSRPGYDDPAPRSPSRCSMCFSGLRDDYCLGVLDRSSLHVMCVYLCLHRDTVAGFGLRLTLGGFEKASARVRAPITLRLG